MFIKNNLMSQSFEMFPRKVIFNFVAKDTKISISRAYGNCTSCDFSVLLEHDYTIYECNTVSEWKTGSVFFETPLSIVHKVTIKFEIQDFHYCKFLFCKLFKH